MPRLSSSLMRSGPSARPAASVTLERGALHHVGNLGNPGVRMHVHHFYALPAHAHFPLARLSASLSAQVRP